MSPSFLFSFGLVFSCIVALVVQNRWGFVLEIETVFIIYVAEIIFILGEVAVRLFLETSRCGDNYRKLQKYASDRINFIIVLISFVLSIVYVKGLLSAAREAGWKSGVIGLLYYIRRATQYEDDISLSRVASWCFNILEALAYYAGFSVVFVCSSRKKKLYACLIVIIYTFSVVFSAGRLPLIIFFIYLLGLWIIKVYQQKNWNFAANKKIIKKLIVPIFAFAGFFLMLGFARRNHDADQNQGRKMVDTIALYAGSGIVGLNQYVVKEEHRSSYAGQTTLNGFYTLMNRCGFSFPTQKNTLEFINVAPRIKSNIYSMFGRLILDYGIAGCFCVVFFMSIFYSFFFYMIRNTNGFGMMMYGGMLYPLFLTGIEEVFLVRFLSIDFIVKVVFYYIVFYGVKISLGKKYFKAVL
ncbi:MAG: oligosaccharide repeat unit polymerase [Treponema sp.]|nr:oligosaccharide repeat unit polymerase [Treponema sp.]